MSPQRPISFFYEIFHPSLPRLGPGDVFSTNKALDIILPHCPLADSPELKVLDLGCGNGGQTVELAKRINGKITAVDNYKPFLNELQRRAEKNQLADKIQPQLKDAECLDFNPATFDIIWCEGAIFTIGFKKGLQLFHQLLKPSGLSAITEMTWLTPNPPQKCRDFLAGPCPEMAETSTNLKIIAETGYQVVDHFVLTESAWWQNLYTPLEERLKSLREKYHQDPKKMELIEQIQMEIDIYREFSKHYGYVFYLIQRQ